MAEDPVQKPRARRWWIALAALAVVAALVWALIAGGVLGAAPTAGPTPGAGTPSASSTPVPKPSIPPATATGSATAVPTREPSVVRTGIHDPAPAGSGITATVERIEAVSGEARGPGEVAGPALRVTIRLRNDSDREIRTDLGLINVYYGADRTPASSLSGPGAAAFPASIAAGKTGEGTAVFGVPTDQRSRIEVEFSYSTDVPVVIFSGSA